MIVRFGPLASDLSGVTTPQILPLTRGVHLLVVSGILGRVSVADDKRSSRDDGDDGDTTM